MSDLEKNVIEWLTSRGIYKDRGAMLRKLGEEVGEVNEAAWRLDGDRTGKDSNTLDLIMEIGDAAIMLLQILHTVRPGDGLDLPIRMAHEKNLLRPPFKPGMEKKS
ncbi:MAG: hypothetical protein V3W44_10010 [Dehalococcoidales bacterium]